MSTTATEQPTATDAAQASQEAAGAVNAAQAGQTDTGAQNAAQEAAQAPEHGADDLAATVARLEKELADTRREAANYRVKGKTAAEEAQAELAQKIGQALGLTGGSDEAPTVESLTSQVTEATRGREQAEARATAAERNLTVFLNAGDADPNRLLKYTDFLDAIKDTDPGDVEAITAAIKKTTADNPWLLKTQAVGASSVDHAGGSGEGAITQERFNAMSPAEKNDLLTTNPILYRQLAGR